MYTVFDTSGDIKRDGFLPAFVRTLKRARELCTEPGETITGWTNSGGVRVRYSRDTDGKLRRIPR